MAKAREAGLDLVEVAPQAKPPVCRIMDYGKWKYAQKKKERQAKAHRHETELKTIRIRTPKIGAHDLQIKVDHARDFLERGDRVQFTLRFRGREMAHVDLGRDVLNGVKEALADVSKVEQDFRFERRSLNMVLASTIKPKDDAKARPKPAADAAGAGAKPKAAPEPAKAKPAAKGGTGPAAKSGAKDTPAAAKAEGDAAGAQAPPAS